MKTLVFIFLLLAGIVIYSFVNNLSKPKEGRHSIRLEKAYIADIDWTKNMDGTPQDVSLVIYKDKMVCYSVILSGTRAEQTLTDNKYSFEIEHSKESTYTVRLVENKVITARTMVSREFDLVNMKGGKSYEHYAPAGEWPFNGGKITLGRNTWLVFSSKYLPK
jgi:hypothetical protein